MQLESVEERNHLHVIFKAFGQLLDNAIEFFPFIFLVLILLKEQSLNIVVRPTTNNRNLPPTLNIINHLQRHLQIPLYIKCLIAHLHPLIQMMWHFPFISQTRPRSHDPLSIPPINLHRVCIDYLTIQSECHIHSQFTLAGPRSPHNHYHRRFLPFLVA